jgi:hypothetical protein
LDAALFLLPAQIPCLHMLQENISPMRQAQEVRHRLVPQFFVDFSPGAGYVPSPRLREAYPQDF